MATGTTAAQGSHDPIASSSTSHLLEPAQLLASPSSALTLAVIEPSLRAIPAAAQVLVCANLVLGGKLLDQVILDRVIALGLDAGQEEIELLEGDVRARLEDAKKPQGKDGWSGWSRTDVAEQVDEITQADAHRRNIVSALSVLADARKRIDTYNVFFPPRARPPADAVEPEPAEEIDFDDDPWADADKSDEEDNVPPILDDPWAEDAEDDEPPEAPAEAKDKTPAPEPASPPIDPATFVLEPLILSGLYFATAAHLTALRVTCQRHASELWPYRLALAEAVSGWVSPGDDDFLPLLPAEGESGEGEWPRGKAEKGTVLSLLDIIAPQFGISALRPHSTDLLPPRRDERLSKAETKQWYTDHVLALDDLGLLDAQLAWVQHATALGVTGLDELGEELSLLSRLIYDANLTPEQLEQWSLTTWREASEDEIVRAYTANATPDTIVNDLRRLVMPYLYVLESRAERSGHADATLVQRMMHEVILDQPLDLALPCFEASKATLPVSQRLVKDDQTVARLALAVLYGSDLQDAWATMSAIFECLPVWDVSGGDVDTDREATETTLDSIADFIRPTATSDGAHSARDLFVFFHPLPFASLSRALDILDVHLESGEILSRYGVRVYLRTLLQSARNHDEQVTLAEQMVRRSTARGDERKWVQLWEDMCRLQGGNDALLRGAFGTLTKEEMMRIFLGGLLSSGYFPVAKKVIRRLEPEGHFTPKDLEDAVLTTSKEFYMRAETGNIHTGDMKLAYECLSVAPQTDAIRNEQEFIQATSRITSFPQLSSLTPAEIRYTPNKLDLIRKVLSTSDDAYKHTAIILELTDKLGYKNDRAARAEVLAMMCDAAVAATEWKIAKERVDEMVAMTDPDTGRKADAATDALAEKVRDVTYRSCLALGRQTEYPDLVDRMALLAQAVALCPADEVPTILPLWRSVQDQISASPEGPLRAHAIMSTKGTAATASSPTESRMLGSRTAARAAKWGLDNLRSFTASPALGSGGASRQMSRQVSGGGGSRLSRQDSRGTGASIARVDSRGSHGSRGSFGSSGRRDSSSALGAHGAAALFDDEDGAGVRAGARRALVKGVGWLLGAEDAEMERTLSSDR